MESDESLQLIRTIGIFYCSNNENLDYVTTRECYSSDPLPDTLLVIDRAKSSLMAYSGLFLLYKTSDNFDYQNFLRLHDEYSVVQITSQKGTLYFSSLIISLDSFLMIDTRQQYLEQISHYFAAFREMFANTFIDVQTRPLTLDELIDSVKTYQ